MSTVTATAELAPCVEEEFSGFKRSFLRLNEFLSWEAVRLVEKGDIVSVKVEGRLKKDRNQFSLIDIPSYYLMPVSIEERIEKIGHLSMQWGVYSWQCPAWLQARGSHQNALILEITFARKGQPLLLNYIAIASETEVIAPLPAPKSLSAHTVEIQFPDTPQHSAKDFNYSVNNQGVAHLTQKGTDKIMSLQFYSPTEAIGKGNWTIDGKVLESMAVRVNFLPKK